MPDDWKPVRKGGYPGWPRKTFRDKNGNPYHYDHNLNKFVDGKWTSKAELKEQKTKNEGGEKDGIEKGG